jgi:hypothetical protein
MKKNLLITLLFYCTISNAQISFEKGYFISNDGKRTECYIKNLDWKNTPTNFKYKIQLTDKEPTTESIATIQEFGINNESTYKRFKIKIDRSNDNLTKISTTRNPDWREETIFLKVLVESDANLYSYTDGDTNKYFYSTKTIPTEQLIYLKFVQVDKNEGAETIIENNEYKQQLFRNVKSSQISEKEILKLKYKKSDLTDYFSKYNNIATASEESDKKSNKKHFLIKVTPGISMVSASLNNTVASRFDVNLDKKIILKIGAEAEYIFPYNKNKWSMFINPTYQKYQDEKNYKVPSGFITNPQTPYVVKINYTSIQLPIGIRHYMFLNQKSKIFISFIYSIDVGGNTEVTYKDLANSGNTTTFKSTSDQSFAFGLGYNFKNKFSFEAKLNTGKELMNYTYYNAKHKAIDLIFGYTIF